MHSRFDSFKGHAMVAKMAPRGEFAIFATFMHRGDLSRQLAATVPTARSGSTLLTGLWIACEDPHTASDRDGLNLGKRANEANFNLHRE